MAAISSSALALLALPLLAIAGGGIAAVAGFGIGSLMTPALTLLIGARLAVAAVAIPHLAGSGLRLWILRGHIDRRVLLGFGIASAIGGLTGAVLQGALPSRGVALAFGVVVALAGISELTGWVSRHRWSRPAAWAAGLLSGALGGLVGNQGGIRAAALLGFDVPKESFVATSTAVALFVDGARVPVYLAALGPQLLELWPVLALLTAGVVVGTVGGTAVLGRLPEPVFRRAVGVLLIALGAFMAVAGG